MYKKLFSGGQNLGLKKSFFFKALISLAALLALSGQAVFTNSAAAQTGSNFPVIYAPVALTSPTNLSLFVEVKAVNFQNGQWNYQLKWNRTLNLQGSVYLTPKADITSVAAQSSPAPRSNINSPMAFRLNPSTRYRLEFYSQPNRQGRLLLRKFFNTLDAAGNPATVTPTPTPTGATTPTPTGTVTPTPTPVVAAGDPSRIYIRMIDNNSGFNGARGMPDPLLVYANNITGTVEGTRRIDRLTVLPPDGRPNPAAILSAEELRNQGNEHVISQRDPSVVIAYTSVGRPFFSPFVYNTLPGKCKDGSITVETVQRNLPSGLSFRAGVDPAFEDFSASGACTYGSVRGNVGSSGIFRSEFKVKNSQNGKIAESRSIVYIISLPANKFEVSYDNVRDTNGNSVSVPVLGGRTRLTWNQTVTGSQAKYTNYFTDLDVWVAPGNVSGQHPDTITNKKLVATVSVNADACNNSTSGGGDSLQFGCGSYNWVAGNTVEGNLQSGDYTIFVTPWLPFVDSRDRLGGASPLERIYGNGPMYIDPEDGRILTSELGYGYSYGAKAIHINAAPAGSKTELGSDTQGGGFANFADIKGGISYVRKSAQGQVIRQGSVGVGTGSNTDQAGCGTSQTAYISCGITINANPGETLDLSWNSKDASGNFLGAGWESTAYVSGPYDTSNPGNLTMLRDCTQRTFGLGLGPNPSEGFMSSKEGSKSFVVPNCLAGKSLYFFYTVAASTYGGTLSTGGVRGEGLLVINISLNENSGEITQNTRRVDINLTGGNCTLNSDGVSYNLSWTPDAGHALADTLEVYAGVNQSQVQNKCLGESNCNVSVKKFVFGKSSAEVNAPVRVGNLSPNTTYYNRVMKTIDGGGDPAHEEVMDFTCRTGTAAAGGKVSSVSRTSTTDTSTPTCSLPNVIENPGCSCPAWDLANCVNGKRYTATWTHPDGQQEGKTFERIVFRAAKGTTYRINSVTKEYEAIDPQADLRAQEAVKTGCPAGSSCIIKDDNVLRDSQSASRQETYYMVSDATSQTETVARTTYWNRVAYVCDFGKPTQQYVDVVWACNTEPGGGASIRP